MQHFARRVVKKISVVIAFLIISIALIFSVSRALSPMVGYSKIFVEKILARSLNHPVHLKEVIVKWAGLEPVIILHDVSIENPHNQKAQLKIDHLMFQVDLLHSLFHFRILPNHLNIDGAHVNLVQQSNKSWQILGLNMEVESEKKEKLGGLKDFFYWLVTQANASISQLDVDLEFYCSQIVSLKNIHIAVLNSKQKHEIVSAGKIKTNKDLHPFRFVLKPENVTDGPKHFNASFYLDLPKLDFSSWLKKEVFEIKKSPIIASIKNIGAEVWGKVLDGNLHDLKMKLRGDEIALENALTHNKYLINKLTSNVFWQKSRIGWQLLVDKFNASANHQLQKTHRLVMHYMDQPNGGSYALYVDVMSIDDIKRLIKLTNNWKESLATWEKKFTPEGTFTQLNFKYEEKPSGNDQFNFIANISDFALNSYQSFPGIDHINGQININEKQGKFILDSKNTVIKCPYLFSKPLKADELKAELTWDYSSKQGWTWKVNKFSFASNVFNFTGNLSLMKQLPLLPQLNVRGKFSAPDIEVLSNYIPRVGLSKELQNWLSQAFHGGKITLGTVSIKGPLDSKNTDLFSSVKMNVTNLGLHYAPNWPDFEGIDAAVTFDNQKMLIVSQHARIDGNEISSMHIEIPNMESPALSLEVHSPLSLQKGLSFLTKTPLEVGKVIASWQGVGNVLFTLKFEKDLRPNREEANVFGTLDFNENQLSIMPALPDFTNIKGVLSFKNERIFSDLIKLNIFGQPLQAKISTQTDTKKNPQLVLEINGNLNAKSIKKNKQNYLPLLNQIKGFTKYHGRVSIENNNDKLTGRITFISDLKGLSLDMPKPFYKNIKQSATFWVDFHFNEKNISIVQAKYNNVLSYYATYSLVEGAYKFLSGNLHFGAGNATSQTKSGLFVDGFLPEFNWGHWAHYLFPYFSEFKQNIYSNPNEKLLRGIQLEVKNISAFQHAFGNTFINFKQQNDNWILNLQNQQVVGEVTVPQKSNEPWLIDIKKLKLAINEENQKQFKTWHHSFDPKKIPAIKLSCQNCMLNHNDFGKITLSLRRLDSGLAVEYFNIQNSNYSLLAKGTWENENGTHVTDLYGYFSNYDLGHFLRSLGVSEAINKGYGETIFSLNWLGEPYHVNWSNLTGHISFRYSDGRIIKLSQQAENEIGLGKFLNILSLQSLPQNLLTGFSSLGAKGFEFNSFNGEIIITNGVGRTNNVKLEGPIAWVDVGGSVDFINETYDLNMKVIPNVTSSLPLIVGLAGGPVAGALTWMANKIFAAKIGQVAEKKYHIQGAMRSPEVTAANDMNQIHLLKNKVDRI